MIRRRHAVPATARLLSRKCLFPAVVPENFFAHMQLPNYLSIDSGSRVRQKKQFMRKTGKPAAVNPSTFHSKQEASSTSYRAATRVTPALELKRSGIDSGQTSAGHKTRFPRRPPTRNHESPPSAEICQTKRKRYSVPGSPQPVEVITLDSSSEDDQADSAIQAPLLTPNLASDSDDEGILPALASPRRKNVTTLRTVDEVFAAVVDEKHRSNPTPELFGDKSKRRKGTLGGQKLELEGSSATSSSVRGGFTKKLTFELTRMDVGRTKLVYETAPNVPTVTFEIVDGTVAVSGGALAHFLEAHN